MSFRALSRRKIIAVTWLAEGEPQLESDASQADQITACEEACCSEWPQAGSRRRGSSSASGLDDPSPKHRSTENTCIGAGWGGGGSPFQLLAEKYRHIHRPGSVGNILCWNAGKCVNWSLRFQNFPRKHALIPLWKWVSPSCDSFTVKHCPPNLLEYPSGNAPDFASLSFSFSLWHFFFCFWSVLHDRWLHCRNY